MFLDDLAARLVSLGVGTLTTTAVSAIFFGPKPIIPEGIGPYISLAETGGTSRLKTHSSSAKRPSAQLVVRASTRAAARSKAKDAHDAFSGVDGCGLFNITLNGVFYLSIIPTQEPFDMPVDEKNRARVMFNLDGVAA